MKASLKGSPVGRVNIIGIGIEDSRIYIDGKLACDRGPCLRSLPAGDHTVRLTFRAPAHNLGTAWTLLTLFILVAVTVYPRAARASPRHRRA